MVLKLGYFRGGGWGPKNPESSEVWRWEKDGEDMSY